ncbi:unnamed protein product [Rotaria socialis]|uniref:DUF6570 domain-containing protein n=1 Tax=Rotaria socialis TaxID=392032 RepID=A0A820MQR8_9BILA|nr:unnamed protein product [Rotaria socialis]
MGDMPNELQGLTIPEQRLIALYRHNSCIVKLHSSFHSAATAQSAIKGNCIAFPQDMVNIAATLPLDAVLDVNGTNISSDDVAEHLFDRMKFQTAEQTRGLTSERSIQKDTVYMIPRGNRPVNEYSNPNILLGILPALFPYGCGAIEDDSRSVQIDFREHLRYLIVFRNLRFEEHCSFIFVVFNILQHRTACFHAHLMTLIRYFQQSAQLLESLSSADIATALVNISKGTYSNIADQRINTLMKHIRGVLWYCREPRQRFTSLAPSYLAQS